MDQTIQKGASGDDHRAREDRTPIPQLHPAHRAAGIEDHVHHFRLLDMQIRLRFQHLPHFHPVLALVALRSRGPDGRPARRIQQAKLDADRIGHLAHNPAQRVHFPHQVPLGDAANSGIARHLRDQVEIETKQRRTQAHTRRRHRRLATCVPRTHYYNVVAFRKPHNPSILEPWQEMLWNRRRSLYWGLD
jgi:hypothetical protein